MEKEPASRTNTLNPFQNIGIAFSGGGFRAAAFALGTLSYLNRIQFNGKNLNENITYTSSASGGTITNLLYVMGIHKGDPFLEIYHHAIEMLRGDRLLNDALKLLNDDSKWRDKDVEKQQNLINSFARVYDRSLFNHEKTGVFWRKDHIREFEVCVNSTEFYRGLSFRFQTDGTDNHHQVIGNNYLWFETRKLAAFKKIKLGDLLASSSCFPIGFEPLVYPEDFTYKDENGDEVLSNELREAMSYENYQENIYPLSFKPDADYREDPKQKAHIRSFGLMDGGITDNQSLNSLMKADKKRSNRKIPNPFDLMIVTDVASYFMDSYEAPVLKNTPGWRQQHIGKYISFFQNLLRKIKSFWLISIVVTVLAIAAAYLGNVLWVRFLAFTILGIGIAFSGIGVLSGYMIFKRLKPKGGKVFDINAIFKNTFHLDRSFSDSILTKLTKYLQLTKLNVFEQMLTARITSVLSMVSDVNLKQVRRLIYETFYNDNSWDDRRMPNFIYELSTHNAQSRSNRIHSVSRLTWKATPADIEILVNGLDKIHEIAEEARLTGTTLWFDQQDSESKKLEKLIMTGQFTTCMNLLEYLISLERKGLSFSKEVNDNLTAFREALIIDLNRFKTDPGFMYNELSISSPNKG